MDSSGRTPEQALEETSAMSPVLYSYEGPRGEPKNQDGIIDLSRETSTSLLPLETQREFGIRVRVDYLRALSEIFRKQPTIPMSLTNHLSCVQCWSSEQQRAPIEFIIQRFAALPTDRLMLR